LKSVDNNKHSALRRDVEEVMRLIAIVSLILASVVFIIGISRGLPVISTFIRGFIVVIVANIPQGLPSTVMTCLLVVAERMQTQNVFVKRLDVVEALGACTLICTDKTGTLTQNTMSVKSVWLIDRMYTAEEFQARNEIESESLHSGERLHLTSPVCALMRAGALNSSVTMIRKTEKRERERRRERERETERDEEKEGEEGEVRACGSASELGLYRFFQTVVTVRESVSIETYRARHTKMFEVPFTSSLRWQASVHVLSESRGRELLLIKGAPEDIRAKCSTYLNKNGVPVTIDSYFNAHFPAACEKLVSSGERVFAYASKPMRYTVREEESTDSKFREKFKDRLVGKWAQPMTDFCFIGLVSLLDTVRPEVVAAVQDCKTAGIKVVMVTGDHPVTAMAVAKEVGIATLPTRDDLARARGVRRREVPDDDVEAVVVIGEELERLSSAHWQLLLNKPQVVYARISPEQKCIIVKKYTERGHVVAMTGNGVNDASALTEAAIGVAMGVEGSEVAREAADMVLLDDNFASVVVGIKEGRLLFSNLKKSIAYSLSHITPQFVPVFLWACVGVPRPLSAILTISIDLLTEQCHLPSNSLMRT